jgi:hypothetical protein
LHAREERSNQKSFGAREIALRAKDASSTNVRFFWAARHYSWIIATFRVVVATVLAFVVLDDLVFLWRFCHLFALLVDIDVAFESGN